jgi:hypothetical protein
MKSELPQIMTTNDNNSKPYDLEERTFRFAKAGRAFMRQLPRTISNIEEGKQLLVTVA